ncbi:leucine-rich repeat domain-containing protein [Treponema sp. OMZ 788]|uniref:leucine-rich repeat domain-containing protein n=1 Tax=Treponema sp. OMZ 788 TaxID=2563664 RepID=UPI0020A51A37|nr:leucine-rich repeat domain-containing protein [Treponema sp. OMZ 788]UTC64723.1 leucine-rich repeat domain-containing protein [Treponema sp. OMZ 788]
MKTNNSKTKTKAFLGAAFVLLIALLFTGCPNSAGAEKPAPPAPPKHAVTFSVEGTPPNGTLKAILGTSEITSGDKVEEGKWVIFTAKADAGYRVKEWKVDGNVIKGHKSNTYPHKVTKPCAITVSFEPKKALLTLAAGKNTVKVKAKTADGKPITVEGCTVTELTSDVETTLTVTNPERKLALIGDIIELNCSGEETPGGNRPLIALDASGLTALQKLDCAKNQLTALNVQGLTALQELYCRTNQIPELNVQGLTKLQNLECYSNKLTSLNVQGCTALQKLDCTGNQLTALNVQGLNALQELYCRQNKLTALNVQGCTALQRLDCIGNQLSTLNVQGLTALQTLKCGGNKLTTLNVQGCTALQHLYCENNQLATLNVQGCTSLKTLLCYKNKLNADAFTKLFNDLPTREVSDKAKALLYADQTASEENCKNFSTPESLKKAFENAKNVKHWKLRKMKGYIEEDI